MFSFNAINRSDYGRVIAANCLINADMPFFNGHFPDFPIMPAASQIEMINVLLRQHTGWNSIIAGGQKLKFSGQIQPGNTLNIYLQRTALDRINFRISINSKCASQGILHLAEISHDD